MLVWASRYLRSVGETDIALCELEPDIEYFKKPLSATALRALAVIKYKNVGLAVYWAQEYLKIIIVFLVIGADPLINSSIKAEYLGGFV